MLEAVLDGVLGLLDAQAEDVVHALLQPNLTGKYYYLLFYVVHEALKEIQEMKERS